MKDIRLNKARGKGKRRGSEELLAYKEDIETEKEDLFQDRTDWLQTGMFVLSFPLKWEGTFK